MQPKYSEFDLLLSIKGTNRIKPTTTRWKLGILEKKLHNRLAQVRGLRLRLRHGRVGTRGFAENLDF